MSNIGHTNRDIAEIQKLREMLLLSERRYEIAMGFSDVTVFDYNVKTKKIVTQHTDYEIFGMPATFEQGVEEVISAGIIAPRSHNDIRELYNKIDNGASSARTTVFATATDGSERVLDLLLVNIYGKDNEPIYAVGVRKDITDLQMLKKERDYGNVVMSDWNFIYEASVSRDIILRFDSEWAENIAIEKVISFSQLVHDMSETVVAPEHIDMFEEVLKTSAIEEAFNDGKRIINFEYRQSVGKALRHEYKWIEQSINIIKDDMTGELYIRCYIKDINERKNKEEHAKKEQNFYESMVSNVDSILEVGISNNTIKTGYDKLFLTCAAKGQYSYDTLMNKTLYSIVHPNDKEHFKELYLRENVVSAYKKGQRELMCEYRVADENGEFKWVNSIMHTFENPETGEIKGFVYSRDIDKAKKDHLELLYKSQHDMLTHFYNKATLEDKIKEYLLTSEAKAGKHAFIILDIDNFKMVNDTFGHAFGDAILSQTAAKMEMLFRTDDFLGRIGGDEFVVFIKNVNNEKTVITKAQELCENLTEKYMQNGNERIITISVGIAIYTEHGKTYDELYHNADSALYHSKEHGRNRFSIFSDSMIHGVTSVNEIDCNYAVHQKAFSENINDYAFHILYENNDKVKAINLVLELVCKHFNCSRVYIYEENADISAVICTYEWCNANIKPRCENLRVLEYSKLNDYSHHFDDGGYFFIYDMENSTSSVKDYMIKDGIKSVAQFAILLNDRFVATFGMDQCGEVRIPTREELADFREMANVLGIFIAEMQATAAANIAKAENEKLKAEIKRLKLG